MLKKRVIVALGGILLISTAVWFDRPLPWFTVFVACYGLLAVLEFYRLVAVSRVRLLAGFGLVWTLLFILSPHFDYLLTIPPLLASAMVLPLVWLVLRPRREGAFTSGTWAIVGVLYVGWLLSFLVALRLEAGRNWVFFALVTTFGSDTLAFFVGWVLGKHRLAPGISPNKTWEGAVAGVFGAVIVGLFFTLATPLGLPLGYGQVMLLGLLVSIFGQLGDLVESL